MADFEVCFGSLSRCRSQPLFTYCFLTDCWTFVSRICWYLAESLIPSNCEMFLLPLAATQPHSQVFSPLSLRLGTAWTCVRTCGELSVNSSTHCRLLASSYMPTLLLHQGLAEKLKVHLILWCSHPKPFLILTSTVPHEGARSIFCHCFRQHSKYWH